MGGQDPSCAAPDACDLVLGAGAVSARGDPELVFGIASVTKIVTAATVLAHVEPDLPVADVLPELRRRRWTPTVADLLSHTSGLPPMGTRYQVLDRCRPDRREGAAGHIGVEVPPPDPLAPLVDCEDVVAYVAARMAGPLAPAGELFSYSNEGFILLAALLERTTGRPFVDLASKLLDRLGLSSARWGAPGAAEHVARPHVEDVAGVRRVPWWDAPAWDPAGGLRMTALDLARLGAWLIGDDPIAVLMRTPHASLESTGTEYGFGVEIGGGLVGHSGGREGVAACLAALPATGHVAVALANLAGVPVDQIARLRLGEAAGVDSTVALADRDDSPSPDLGEFAGTYSSAEGLMFEVEGGARLIVEHRGARLGGEWWGRDRFAVGGTTVRFLRRDGAVWALAVGDRVVPRSRSGSAASECEAADRRGD